MSEIAVEGDEQHSRRSLHRDAHLVWLSAVDIVNETAALADPDIGLHQADVQLIGRVGYHIAADPE
ncbi:hypothetical protein [Microvirga sp. BSC39]|uniref:hypothetical protein n=1 Tax=Microvirga sp. BSC39 TaxID=1549810 RepID=UPI0004E8E787|nr:hypothetical protein [Microvirga sp. BSC39]KFG69382.1 hypothetical protein JH26_11190 [Microvirga sp. BSC39]